MTQQTINLGTTANDGSGDPLRTAFTKINANFTDLYTQINGLEFDAVIPSQTGNNGKYLTTNGSALSWGTISTTTSTLNNGSQELRLDNSGNVWLSTANTAFINNNNHNVSLLSFATDSASTNATITLSAINETAGQDYEPNSTIGISSSSGVYINLQTTSGTAYEWQFESNGNTNIPGAVAIHGNLTFNDSTVQTTAWTGILPSPTYSGSSSIGNVTPAALNLNNTGSPGQVETQLTLINTAGNANTGSAIDFFTYTDAGNGVPGARIQSVDDGNFSSNFSIVLKATGNNGNGSLSTQWTFGSNGSFTAPGDIVISNGNNLRLTAASYGASLVTNGSTFSFSSSGLTLPNGGVVSDSSTTVNIVSPTPLYTVTAITATWMAGIAVSPYTFSDTRTGLNFTATTNNTAQTVTVVVNNGGTFQNNVVPFVSIDYAVLGIPGSGAFLFNLSYTATSGNPTFGFGVSSDGNIITLPGGADILVSQSPYFTGSNLSFSSYGGVGLSWGTGYAQGDNNNGFEIGLVGGSNPTWNFMPNGQLAFPDSTKQNTAWTGSVSSLVNGSYTLSLASNGDLTVPTSQYGTAQVFASTTNTTMCLGNSSHFIQVRGSDGAIVFPDYSVQTTAYTGWPVSNATGSSGPTAIAIGKNASALSPGNYIVSIGSFAGQTSQGDFAVAIGWNAGSDIQSTKAVAIGNTAGQNSQGTSSVAIGDGSAYNNQGTTAISIGKNAGYLNQGNNAIAIGNAAGNTSQGANSIAIGQNAGQNSQPANTIILNATGSELDGVSSQASSFYVAPIRTDATPTNVLYYNTTTNEVTYGTPASAFQPNGVFNITTTGGTTVLTSSTAQNITLTGSNTQTIQLPDATTLKAGWIFRVNNNSSSASNITVNNAGGSQVGLVPQGGDTQVILLDNSTANGSWDYHGWVPSNLLMGSSIFQLGSSAYTIAPYNSSLTIGTSTGGTTYNFGTGATLSGNTKTINIGTGGVSGSTTTITVGSAIGTSTTAFNGTTTFNAAVKLNGVTTTGIVATAQTAGTIASAATIAPTNPITFVSGNTQITTITPPSGIATYGGQITLIPIGTWTTGTGGNIGLATTAVTNKALIMTYDAGTTKWYPSY